VEKFNKAVGSARFEPANPFEAETYIKKKAQFVAGPARRRESLRNQ
jgi:hypothetical protein